MAKLYNLARMTTATTGTGTITLGSAVSSYVSFADAGVQNGETVTYAIVDGSNREIGRGVYTSSGTTLTRATILESTNSNNAITLSGSAEVFITAAAEDIANKGETNTFTASQIISVTDNSNAALRVTQEGTGDALLIEDSTNPDSSPLVVNASGSVIAGHTANIDSTKVQVVGTSQAASTLSQLNYSGLSTPASHRFYKSKNSTVGSHTIVSSGDGLGNITFYGSDGTAFIPGASIEVAVDGTPGANDMPSRIVFNTTGDGASAPSEKLRIGSEGQIGIIGGNYGTSGQVFTSGGASAPPTWQTIANTQVSGLGTMATQNSDNVSITGGSITGITDLAVADGGTGASDASGARTNLSAAGTGVSNTFTANQIISVTDNSNAALRVTQLGTGNAILVEDDTNPDSTPFVVDALGEVGIGTTTPTLPLNIGDSTLPTGVTLEGQLISSSVAATRPLLSLRKAATTGNAALAQFRARGTESSPTAVQINDGLGRNEWYGFDGTNYLPAAYIVGAVDATPGTSDMPGRLVFSTTADGASSPTERFRIGSAGQLGIAGANYGTSGQTLVSGGSAAAPSWSTLGVAGGGTGITSATAYALLAGGTTSTGAFQSISGVGTSGQVLTSNGAGALPTWQTSSANSMTLLGTITTTSGTSLTLTGLTLTSYKQLFISINSVSSSSATDDLSFVDGAGNSILIMTDSANAAHVWNGIIVVALDSGAITVGGLINTTTTYAAGNSDAGSGASGAKIRFGRANISTASTSLGVSVQTGFDAGSVTVYGVK